MVHTFACVGDTAGAIVPVNSPGGFHHLYAELAHAFTGDGPPDLAATAAAAARHGAEILGPPLSALGPTN